MKTVLFVFGTRPEVIKLAPVIQSFKKDPKFKVLVCNTAQHRQMTDQLCTFFDIKSDFDLDVMKDNQRLTPLLSRLLTGLNNILCEVKLDGVFAQGDTMTVLAASTSAFLNKIPFFHVEAGLRSYNFEHPYPEEYIRQCVARGAALHFAPTQKAFNSLMNENIKKESIHITGNTVIDSIVEASERINSEKDTKKIVLITAHRRENHGERLNNILGAIEILAKNYGSKYEFILPVHPSPKVKSAVEDRLSNIPSVRLTQPLDYFEIVKAINSSHLILTDSGGIQEEATAFKCPVLVLRDKTERMEAVETGFAKLVGSDQSLIVKRASEVLDKNFEESRVQNNESPYGDGTASLQILKIVKAFYDLH